MSGSHHRLEVRYPLISTAALRFLEYPIRKNSATILQVCISILLLPQWFQSLKDLPCKDQWTKLVMTVVKTEDMTELGESEVSSIQIWKYRSLQPTYKSHGPMVNILSPSGTTWLGASVWGSMVVAVNIPLTRATDLPSLMGGSCLLGQKQLRWPTGR